MIATLRESKAKLSELVERAAAGEEVLITVRGRPKARLVAAQSSNESLTRMTGWAGELRELQLKCSLAPGSQSVVEELRDERW